MRRRERNILFGGIGGLVLLALIFTSCQRQTPTVIQQPPAVIHQRPTIIRQQPSIIREPGIIYDTSPTYIPAPAPVIIQQPPTVLQQQPRVVQQQPTVVEQPKATTPSTRPKPTSPQQTIRRQSNIGTPSVQQGGARRSTSSNRSRRSR